MWVQPALDPDLGLLYVNTGNPWPDYNGSTRGGANLFTDSVVALDAMTGSYRWHYQSVHHDLWDFDMATPLILFDQVYNGEMHHALAAHSKQAWVYILDRVSGKPLIQVEEKPVPQTCGRRPWPRSPFLPAIQPLRNAARPSKAISKAACSHHIGATPRSLNRRQRAIGRPALTIHSRDICSSQPKWPPASSTSPREHPSKALGSMV